MTSYAGHLYLGGAFTQAGGKPSAAIARWDGPTPPVIEPAEAEVAPHEPLKTSQALGRLVSVSGTRSALMIRYEVGAHALPAELLMYDVRGRLIASIAQEISTPGPSALHWNGAGRASLPRGIYFLQMRSRNSILDVKKVILRE
jgi:hypothetical protein